ncbi:MAG: TetR/AcrR family transcriptional regulator [Xanthomonadales bacterium]|nr:TetR/AcrR family transcriptional regulator [Xanthomonadales bacterium]
MAGDSSSERYRQQRARAVEAAASVFAHKGYHGASTADIAESMGIKQGSLYYYFKSKEEALEEVCLLGLRDYVHRMELIVSNDQPFEARLLAVVQSHLSGYREKNEALKVYNDERLYLPESRRRRLKQQGSHYREMLEGMFRNALEAGVVRRNLDCHFAAQSVIGICNAMGELIVRDPQLDLFELTQKCTDLLLIGLSEH